MLMSRDKTVEEETPKQPTQRLDGEEEGWATTDPPSVTPKPATGHDAMDMRMMGECLSPGVKHSEEPDLGTEMAGIGGERHDGVRRASHQQGVDGGLVLEGDLSRRRRQGEDNVKVRHRQKIGLACGEPVVTRGGLALRTMPVAAGVVGNADCAAVATSFDMSAQRGGPAKLDGTHDTTFAASEMAGMVTVIGGAVKTEDVRQLDGRHDGRLNSAGQPGEKAYQAGFASWRSDGSTPACSERSSISDHARAEPE